MHAALSVLIFTVTAGFGLGLIIWSGLATLFNSHTSIVPALILAMILTSIGLVASTFHLANPKNAWRAFNRFRTSWLSREGILAVALYPVVALLLLAVILEWNVGAQKFLAFIMVIIAIATIYSTSMIYACLKTIRQWHTALVPINFMIMALGSGALIWAFYLSISSTVSGGWLWLAGLLMVLGLIGKAVYYFWIGKPAGPTINTAIGITQASVKLLDVGHENGTFLQREFGHKIATDSIWKYRFGVYLFGFILPFLLIGSPHWTALLLAVIFNYIGLLIERWLFFIEARHVVNLFHGDQAT